MVPRLASYGRTLSDCLPLDPDRREGGREGGRETQTGSRRRDRKRGARTEPKGREGGEAPTLRPAMEFTDPHVAEQLLAEMEEKEQQLALAAEFGTTLLARTEELLSERNDLEREREAAVLACEEHEYRARELASNVERLAEEAAEKDHALETARLELEQREAEMEERMRHLQGTEAEKDAQRAEMEEALRAEKAEAAGVIANMQAEREELNRRGEEAAAKAEAERSAAKATIEKQKKLMVKAREALAEERAKSQAAEQAAKQREEEIKAMVAKMEQMERELQRQREAEVQKKVADLHSAAAAESVGEEVGGSASPSGVSLADDISPDSRSDLDENERIRQAEATRKAAEEKAEADRVAAAAAAEAAALRAEVEALKAKAEAERQKQEDARRALAAADRPAVASAPATQSDKLFSDSDDDDDDPLRPKSRKGVFDDSDDDEPLSPFQVASKSVRVAEGVPPGSSRQQPEPEPELSTQEAVEVCTRDDTEPAPSAPMAQLEQLVRTIDRPAAEELAKWLSARVAMPVIPVKLKSLQLIEKLLKVSSPALYGPVEEKCALVVKQATAFRQVDPEHGDKPAQLIRQAAVKLLKLIDLLHQAANQASQKVLPATVRELPRAPRKTAAASLRAGGAAGSGWQASVSKAVDEWTEKVTTWTTSWTLSQFPDDMMTGTSPVVWLRHTRTEPEHLQLFWNDQLLYGRVGVTAKVATPNGADRAMGDVETITFERHGEQMALKIKTGPVPVSMFGRATAVCEYCLEIDNVLQKRDRENKPDPRNLSKFAQRVMVSKSQQVAEKRHELDWSADTMVVEYSLHLLPPGFATGGGTLTSISSRCVLICSNDGSVPTVFSIVSTLCVCVFAVLRRRGAVPMGEIF